MLGEPGSERIEREWRGGVSAQCRLQVVRSARFEALAQQVERILNHRTTSLQLGGVEQSAEAD
jgi:hypothetical protein